MSLPSSDMPFHAHHLSAYICHHEMDLVERPMEGNDYWFGKIEGIHILESKIWVIVAWYYNKAHMEALGQRFNQKYVSLSFDCFFC